jgi:nucleoside 2-deoxyribosyltransferase
MFIAAIMRVLEYPHTEMAAGEIRGFIEVLSCMERRSGVKAEDRKLVYCSGPLFCPEEIGVMSDIARVLEEAGYGTFLPHRDGVEAYVMNSVNNPFTNLFIFNPIARFVYRATFALDIYQVIERCDYSVFNMNGRVPDEGVMVELAAAFASGKPLVIYKDDRRSLIGGWDSPMLSGASRNFSVVDDIARIPRELAGAIDRLGAFGESPYEGENIPFSVREVVDFGRKVWRLARMFRFLRPKNSLIS